MEKFTQDRQQRHGEILDEREAGFHALQKKVEQYDDLQQVVETIVAATADPVLAERKKEILSENSEAGLLRLMSDLGVRDSFKSFLTARGHVFERLVAFEVNFEVGNAILGNFVLEALSQPGLVGLDDEAALRRPDRIGVTINEEEGVAEITGMYEVKIRYLSFSGRKQVAQFYADVAVVIEQFNQQVEELREKYNLNVLPPNGFRLKPYDEMKKFLVLTHETPEAEVEKTFRETEGWGRRESIFSEEDIELLTAYLLPKVKVRRKRRSHVSAKQRRIQMMKKYGYIT